MKEFKLNQNFKIPGSDIQLESGDSIIIEESDLNEFADILKSGGTVKFQVMSTSKKSDVMILNKANFYKFLSAFQRYVK